MLVGYRKRLRAAAGEAAPEGDPRGLTARDAHPPPQREHRIEHGADRIRQRPSVEDGHCITEGVPAAQESPPVGLELQTSDGLSFQRAHVEHPQLLFAGLSDSARRQQHPPALGNELGLHEQFRKCRMGGIRGWSRQHHFRVRRELDFAHPPARIGHGDAAHLGVVLGRDEYFRARDDRPVLAIDLGAILEECPS